MKVLSFKHVGRQSFGVMSDDGVRDCGALIAGCGSLLDVLRAGKLGELATASADAPVVPLDEIEFLPVVPDPGKILCVGANYKDHLDEAGPLVTSIPTAPVVFVRFPSSQCGHGEAIVRPPESTDLDFEGELALVIGKAGRRIPKADALNHVAGYSAYNDATLRDYQMMTIQFTPGKNFPSTGGFGPWLVTSDEIRDPSDLSIVTRLNGEVMQNSSTRYLMFDIPTIIAAVSTWTPLEAGDVIITGTPGGVGMFRQPPVWMKAGDVVEVEIGGVGVLRNTIADE